MTVRLRKLLVTLQDTFWLLPALMIVAGILLAFGFISLDRSDLIPKSVISGPWLYNGGATGARTLLGVVASSTIGVAGTVFSITIAALTLAAGQMGPRLLRNFTSDRGNQFTLGAFLGTFSYALMVLRTVRTKTDGEFVPHVALSVGIVLAFVCVATLIFFVGHMASRINVDTVIELVSSDVRVAIRRLTSDEPGTSPPPESSWRGAVPVFDQRQGYLQQLDDDGLADWAAEHDTAIRLLARPGTYIFPGTPIALIYPSVEGADAAIRNATALGAHRVSSADIEFAIGQLVEVAVRALSPGINDPHTAISVLDRLGAALCHLAPHYLPTGVLLRDDHVRLVIPAVDYAGLVDTMFHEIRQNAAGSAAVLIHMLEVLTDVIGCETTASRVATLQRHADLVMGDAERDIRTPGDLNDIRKRHHEFATMRDHGPLGLFASPRGDAAS